MQTEFSIVNFDSQYAPYIVYIRHKVFTIEQQIAASEDLDGNDPEAIHVLARIDGHYVGTARMMLDGHIGRLAVDSDFRHNKIGTNLIVTLINEAKQRDLKKVYLGAQCVAKAFYKTLGFKEYGEIFQEVGIDHVMMKMEIN